MCFICYFNHTALLFQKKKKKKTNEEKNEVTQRWKKTPRDKI